MTDVPPAAPRPSRGRIALAVGAVVLGLVVLSGVLWNLVDQNPQPDASSPGIATEGLEILYPQDGAVVDTSRMQVRGTAPAGAAIVLTRRSAPDSHATAEGDGEWFMTVQLDLGVNELVFTIGSNSETEVQLEITYEPPAEPEPTAPPAPATTATGNMTEGRANHTATLLPDGSVLVAGGDGGGRSLASAELYDPTTGSWTATGSLVTARFGHTATLMPDGTLLVAGGNGLNRGIGGPLASAELYDPSSGSWTVTGSLATPRQAHTATLLPDGRVLVAGGTLSGGGVASTEVYDPNTGSWTATGNMTAARYSHAATLLSDGRVLVTGGISGGGVASTEVYDPNTGSWTATGNMTAARYSHAATLLSDGKVLVAGGSGGAAGMASAELYDPDIGSWTTTGNLIEARSTHTATLLPDGTVLVTGGDPILASTELYDPSSGAWTTPGVMVEARTNHTATMLPDGRVLVTGGFCACGGMGFLPSAELFDPKSGT